MRRRKGFTLLELITVIIIIGILAVVAFPQFINAMERSRLGTAISKLGMLRKAEGVYHTLYSEYIDFDGTAADPAVGLASEVPEVIEFNDKDYTYECAVTDADHYDCTATKIRGTHNGEVVVMNQDGQIADPAGSDAWNNLVVTFQKDV